MFRVFYALAVFTITIFLSACNDNITPADNGASIVIRLMETDSTTAKDSLVVSLGSLPSTDLSGESAVSMEAIIAETFIPPYVDKSNVFWDKRELYGFRIIGADGFSPHQKTDKETGKTADDLTWEQIRHGYVKKSSHDVAFDASVTLAGVYRVKEMAAIELYRKIDALVDTGATQSTCQIRLAEIAKTDFSGAPSIKLSAILASIATPDTFTYTVTALDDYTGMSPFTWAQMQTGSWICSTDRLGFDPDLGGQSKISYVKQIRVSR
jgi:hypothetical protein